MDYIRKQAKGQLTFTQSTEFLIIPSCLYGFTNTSTTTETAVSNRTVLCFHCSLNADEENTTCRCGCHMHINNHPSITLRHLPIGGYLSCVKLTRNQYFCPRCHKSYTQFIAFKADGYRITEELFNYSRDLLSSGNYTNKEVAEITGLGKNTVKDIDKQRLQELYTMDGTQLIKPEKAAKFLGIDELVWVSKLKNHFRSPTPSSIIEVY